MRVIVDTRKIAAEYRLNHWAQIIQERNGSGLSIKAYCESIGLRQNVYHYCQRKLREAAIIATTAQSESETAIVPQAPQRMVVRSATLSDTGVSCPGGQPDCTPKHPGLVVPLARSCSPMRPGWVLCETAKPESTQGRIQIEIGKSRVTADASTDHELLAKVCRMLVSLC